MNNRILIGIVLSAAFALGAWLTFSNMIASSPLNISVYVFLTCVITAFALSSAQPTSKKQSVSAEDGELTTLYVGNLPYKANEDAVKDFFNDYVSVQSVRLMKDKRTGKRKGYGFIEILTNDVDSAISQLNDIEFHDRTLKVRPAKEKTAEKY